VLLTPAFLLLTSLRLNQRQEVTLAAPADGNEQPFALKAKEKMEALDWFAVWEFITCVLKVLIK